MKYPWNPIAILLIAGMSLMACSDETEGQGEAEQCEPQQVWNPVQGICVDQGATPPGGEDGADVGSAAEDGGLDSFPGEQPVCGTGEERTSITGVVQIPSGEVPLPEVAVYVPRGVPTTGGTGAQCRPCEEEQISDYVVKTRTNTVGEFRLEDVPVGQDIPLVIEVGKWRREVKIDEVLPCQENPLGEELTRLPRSRAEGELPRIAVTTGGWDALECLIRKIGVEESEFTTHEGDGWVHLYAGQGGTDRFGDGLNDGAALRHARDFWSDLDQLMDYDLVAFSCEGNLNMGDKPAQARQALLDYSEAGGRVFLSHFHYGWLRDGPEDFRSVATWADFGAPTGDTETGTIDTTFHKGMMLRDWMYLTGTEPSGQFEIAEARGSIVEINEEVAQRWIWLDEPQGIEVPDGYEDLLPGIPGVDQPPEELVQYFSFNTPVGAPEGQQCGRVVFSDIHVSAEESSSPEHPFPAGCSDRPLTDQEKALVFLLFDLSRCVVPDKKSAL